MKQLQQKKNEGAERKTASESQKGLSGDRPLDLRRFGKNGSAKHSNGTEKAQEAPTHFQTQVNPLPQSLPPSPRPPSQPAPFKNSHRCSSLVDSHFWCGRSCKSGILSNVSQNYTSNDPTSNPTSVKRNLTQHEVLQNINHFCMEIDE